MVFLQSFNLRVEITINFCTCHYGQPVISGAEPRLLRGDPIGMQKAVLDCLSTDSTIHKDMQHKIYNTSYCMISAMR